MQDCVEGHGLQKTFLCWMSLWDLSPCCPYLTHLIKPGMRGRLALSRCRVSCPVLWIHREFLCYKASHKERIWQSGWNSELELGNLSSNTRKSLASLCPGLSKWENGGQSSFGSFSAPRSWTSLPSVSLPCLQIKSTWVRGWPHNVFFSSLHFTVTYF